jgi:hypothetical protein
MYADYVANLGGYATRPFAELSRPICICAFCGILYFKLNEIDAINEITKPRII